MKLGEIMYKEAQEKAEKEKRFGGDSQTKSKAGADPKKQKREKRSPKLLMPILRMLLKRRILMMIIKKSQPKIF